MEQHRDEVTRLRTQIEAQGEAHKAEVVQLTSALSAQADEKIRLEGEVQKYKDLLAEAETRATAVQQKMTDNTHLLAVCLRDLGKIDGLLASKLP